MSLEIVIDITLMRPVKKNGLLGYGSGLTHW